MFSSRSSFLIAFLLVASHAGPGFFQAQSAAQNQQQARTVIDQMITALGGKAYLTVVDMECEGRSGVFDHGRSQGSTEYHRLWKWPDKDRLELTKQRDVVQLTVGDSMYEVTFRGTRMIDPERDGNAKIYLARRNHALEVVLRRWLEQPGAALFYEGTALAENHSVDRITVINAENDAVTFSIDQATHLPVKKTFVIRDAQGNRQEIAEIYDNWKKVQDINTPFSTLATINGELSRQYFLSTVSYNKRLADSLFSPERHELFAKPSPRQ